MTDENSNQAIAISRQMLASIQQLVLLDILDFTLKAMQGRDSRLPIILKALNDCAETKRKNPSELTATLHSTVALFTEWEGRELR